MEEEDEETHEMELVTVHGKGWQEYYCPYCRRRFLVSWRNRFRQILLTAGNAEVKHTYMVQGKNEPDDWLGPYTDYLNR